jgi:hypothetical protein
VRILRTIAIALFTVLGLFFGKLAIDRKSLDYNEQRVYFDADAGVTYSEQAIVAYASISILCFFILMILVVTKNRSTHERK